MGASVIRRNEYRSVWTNANVDASFASQTINISNLSKYNFIMVVFHARGSSSEYINEYFTEILPYRNGATYRVTIPGYNKVFLTRTVTVSATGLTFGNAEWLEGYRSDTNRWLTSNTMLIPVQIFVK